LPVSSIMHAHVGFAPHAAGNGWHDVFTERMP